MSKVQHHRDQLSILADALADDLDGALIGVGYHRDGDWEPVYMRPDFAERFTEEQKARMANEVILDGLLKTAEETVWGFGSMQFKLLRFEEAYIAHVPISDTEGVAVGIDAMPIQEFMAALEPVFEYCHDT